MIVNTLYSEIDFIDSQNVPINDKDSWEDCLGEADFNRKCRMYREAI